MTELEAASVQILRLEPGDEIVLTVERAITRETAEELKRQARKRWPGHEVTVLYDVAMSVVRKGE